MVRLNTPMFNDALNAIVEIYGIFSWTLPEGSLEWRDFISHGKNDMLHISNRLLTPRKDMANMNVITPVNGVNLCRVLKAIIDEGEYQYCDDNEVKYFEQKTDKNRKKW